MITTPKASWVGTIQHDLISVPVKLIPQHRTRATSFKQVVRVGGALECPITERKDSTGATVEPADLLKGHEVGKGTYVEIPADELEACKPESDRVMRVDCYVNYADVDPASFDCAYHVFPDKGGEEAYNLLRNVLAETGKAAVVRFVKTTREYVALIVPSRTNPHLLVAQQLVYADEIVDVSAVENQIAALAEPDKKARAMATQLVKMSTEKWDPTRYWDKAQDKIEAVIAAHVSTVASADGKSAPDQLQLMQQMIDARKAEQALAKKKGAKV